MSNKNRDEEEDLTFGQKLIWWTVGLIIISIIYPIASPHLLRF